MICKLCGSEDVKLIPVSGLHDMRVPFCLNCKKYPETRNQEIAMKEEVDMSVVQDLEKEINNLRKELHEARLKSEKQGQLNQVLLDEGKATVKAVGDLEHGLNLAARAISNARKDASSRLKIDLLPESISDWCRAAHGVSKSKGWYDDPESADNFPTKLCLVHSEVSEVLEEYRNNKGLNEIYYSDKGKPEGVPVEIADILIRLFDMCGYWNIDLEEALKIKHEYNKTRPHRHGGKKI